MVGTGWRWMDGFEAPDRWFFWSLRQINNLLSGLSTKDAPKTPQRDTASQVIKPRSHDSPGPRCQLVPFSKAQSSRVPSGAVRSGARNDLDWAGNQSVRRCTREIVGKNQNREMERREDGWMAFPFCHLLVLARLECCSLPLCMKKHTR